MRKNRKVITLILVVGMLLSVAACSGSNTTDPDTDAPEVTNAGPNTAPTGTFEVAKLEYTFSKLG